MIKAIWPELDVNIGSNKLGTDTVSNSTVGAFNRAKLMTAIRTSRTNSKAMPFKELSGFSRTIHFSTLIEANISSVVTSRTV